MRVADAVSCGVGPPQWNLSTAWASLTAMTTQMASTSDRSGTRLLSDTVTNVPGVSSSGDKPRQHGLDFPHLGYSIADRVRPAGSCAKSRKSVKNILRTENK